MCRKLTVLLTGPSRKHIDFLATPGATVGCDLAGVVEEVGPKVTKSFKKGDRISGFAHGGNAVELEDGCFAQYAVVKGDLAIAIPDNLSDEEAATLGVGVSTVGQGLYQSLGLPLPGFGKLDEPLLIYGGSTATGTLAIQYAVLSGAKVITTCSPRNFPVSLRIDALNVDEDAMTLTCDQLVKSLGAAEAFDYNDPDCAKKIREYTNDSLTKAFDCVSEGESPKICSEAISSKGGVVSYLLFAKHDRTDVENKVTQASRNVPFRLSLLTIFEQHTLAYTVTGEGFKFGPKEYPPNSEDFEFAKKFWDLSAMLLANGQIKVHALEKGKDGLKGVFDGMQKLKDGKVSGKKLVYGVADTP